MDKIGCSFCGIKVNPLTYAEIDQVILEFAIPSPGKRPTLWANHNFHSLYIFHTDSRMREFYAATDFTHVDGMPLIWVAQLFRQPLKREHRMTAIPLMQPLLNACQKHGVKLFLLGGEPGVAPKAAAKFQEMAPGIQIAHYHGYFDRTPGGSENEAVLAQINSFQPGLLIVGMGMPIQEQWILENLDRLEVGMVTQQGAFMDYFAGKKIAPPRWMGNIGLEWLYRLITEPKRLSKRYLVEPILLIPLLIRYAITKRFPSN